MSLFRFTDASCQMAADALTAFLQRDFTRTNHALLSLTSDSSTDLDNVKILTDDPRIRHNALVAQFYHTPSDVHVDNIIFYVSEFLPIEQRPDTVKHFFDHIVRDPSVLKFLYNHVGAVALYNVAVIAYHRCLIAAAATVGELLFEKVEALDEWLALNTCFLLTDIHLRLSNVSSAVTVLSYAEKLLPAFNRPLLNNQNNNSNENSDNNNHNNTNDSTAHADHLAEFRSLSPEWPARSTAILEPPQSYEHAKFCMLMYNARLSADSDATDGGRNIRKEAKCAVQAADDAISRPTSAALLVKARVEQNFSKGLRILASIVNQSPPHMLPKVRPLALNSLGVLHHRLGRHALAACYFEQSRRAFTELFAPSKESSFHLSIFSAVKDTHVAYNLALQYMKTGQYSTALQLLTTCAHADTVFASRSAMLWIRMAECCVALESSDASARSSLSLEGKGQSRRMVMRVSEKTDIASMEYASCCARAALDILDEEKKHKDKNPDNLSTTDFGKESKTPWADQMKLSSVAGAANTQRSAVEEMELRAAAWSLIAYASLSFDASAVVDASDELLKLYPKGEHERCTLAHLYAAEAYCMQGRAKEAVTRLTPLLSQSLILDPHVREAAYVNMALTHASSEDLVTASRVARIVLKFQSGGGKRPGMIRKESIFAVAYIFLRNGDTASAREALRLIYSCGE